MAVLTTKGAQAITMEDGLLFAELNNIPVHWISARAVTITVGGGTYTITGHGFGKPDAKGFPHAGTITGIAYASATGGATLTGGSIAAATFASLMAEPARLNALLFAGADTLTGGSGDDWLRAEGGDDTVRGQGGDDVLEGRDGDDRLDGGAGDDFVSGGAGRDIITGGTGDDNLEGWDGDDAINGGVGVDIMRGGAGDDVYVVDALGDIAIELKGAGTDTVVSSVSYVLGDNIEALSLTGTGDVIGTGNGLDNTLRGNTGWSVLYGEGGDDVLIAGSQIGDHDRANEAYGGDGNDRITGAATQLNAWGEAGDDAIVGSRAGDYLHGGDGNDIVRGGAGNDYLTGGDGKDRLEGGAGADRLYGGAGADQFLFREGSLDRLDKTDRVLDFKAAEGDRIDLRLIDADTGRAGDQAFSLVDGFSKHAGEMVLSVFDGYANAHFDTDGDGRADFSLRIDGVTDGSDGWLL